MQLARVVNAGEGLVHDLGGPRAESLTSPEEEEAYCVMKGTVAPAISVPLHSHDDAESFYVLSGRGEVLLQTKRGLEWRTLQPGDFAHIAGGAKHAWRNRSADSFEVILITTPKLGRFLREFGELIKAEGLSLEKLQHLSERYGYWTGNAEENAEVGISLP